MTKNTKEKNRYTKVFFYVSRLDVLAAGIASFLAISTISYIFVNYNSEFLIASFGASAVILYATPDGIFARPRNFIGGHLLAGTVGILMYNLFGITWWSISIGVTTSIVLMMLTDTIHPPAGATAIVAILGKADPSFLLMPLLSGVSILLIWNLLMKKIKVKIRER